MQEALEELVEAAEQGRLTVAVPAEGSMADGAEEAHAGEGPLRSSLLDRVWELTKDLTPEDWASLPEDLSEQHDHYIYGTPKQ